MRGLVTERHFRIAERSFPGIRRFYLSLLEKPRTFLELVWQYQSRAERSPDEGREPRAGAARLPR